MGRSLSPPATARSGDSRAARFRLLYRGEELVLEPGQYVIGRSPASEIVVDDPLASRRHARLLANDSTVLLEDLRSDNGVFVNEHRIRRSVRLEDGDRILVGRQELVFSVLPPNATQKLWSGVLAMGTSVPPPLSVLDPTTKDGAATLKLNAVSYLEELAEKMHTLGRPKSAERVLNAHLWDVLQAARRGEQVDRAILDSAAHSAMKLAAGLRAADAARRGIERDRARHLHDQKAAHASHVAAQIPRGDLPHVPERNRARHRRREQAHHLARHR
jgi:pSer/pThr/pTyr-binding forkhead associated (FHA) protein